MGMVKPVPCPPLPLNGYGPVCMVAGALLPPCGCGMWLSWYVFVVELHCIAIALHCTAAQCIALHCSALIDCIALHCIASPCIAWHCIAYCIAGAQGPIPIGGVGGTEGAGGWNHPYPLREGDWKSWGQTHIYGMYRAPIYRAPIYRARGKDGWEQRRERREGRGTRGREGREE